MKQEQNKEICRVALKTLAKISDEIRGKFYFWNVRTENRQEPVPIQDLDYWNKEINKAVVILRNALQFTPGEVEPK